MDYIKLKKMGYVDVVNKILQEYLSYLGSAEYDIDYIINMEKQINNIQVSIEELTASANTMSKQDFYSQIDN